MAAHALKPGIEVIGVQTERFPSMYCAVRGESPAFGMSTIADGIAVKAPGMLTLPIIKERVSDILLVDDLAHQRAFTSLAAQTVEVEFVLPDP